MQYEIISSKEDERKIWPLPWDLQLLSFSKIKIALMVI